MLDYKDLKGLPAMAMECFIREHSGNQVKRIDGDNNITDIGAGYNGPLAVAVGADGHVFIADTGNGKIKS